MVEKLAHLRPERFSNTLRKPSSRPLIRLHERDVADHHDVALYRVGIKQHELALELELSNIIIGLLWLRDQPSAEFQLKVEKGVGKS